MRKTVVILIPVYNSERTLKVCVDSLLAQDYPHIKEIIFMDNLSTDATPSILKSYGKKITVKRLSGLVPEMYNKIIPGIDSDCIAFTDGDVIADRSWISNLVKGFNMPEIKATAGYCGTVESSNVLQQAIGEELEDRFRHFSTFIGRAPTMNLCVDTEVMKRLMYDSTLRVAYDTDFGMRLNEAGFLMRYVPDAVIYHDHRASWKAYYRQQNTYAKYAPLVYMKHFGQTAGDSISMSTMMFQPMAYGLCVFFLLLSSGDFFGTSWNSRRFLCCRC